MSLHVARRKSPFDANREPDTKAVLFFAKDIPVFAKLQNFSKNSCDFIDGYDQHYANNSSSMNDHVRHKLDCAVSFADRVSEAKKCIKSERTSSNLSPLQ